MNRAVEWVLQQKEPVCAAALRDVVPWPLERVRSVLRQAVKAGTLVCVEGPGVMLFGAPPKPKRRRPAHMRKARADWVKKPAPPLPERPISSVFAWAGA